VMELVARVTGRTPMMTRETLAMARKKMFFSSAKAIEVLGYAPRPAREAVEDALDYFATQGLLR
jgi:dihydroflavonol-4-reductase